MALFEMNVLLPSADTTQFNDLNPYGGLMNETV